MILSVGYISHQNSRHCSIVAIGREFIPHSPQTIGLAMVLVTAANDIKECVPSSGNRNFKNRWIGALSHYTMAGSYTRSWNYTCKTIQFRLPQASFR